MFKSVTTGAKLSYPQVLAPWQRGSLSSSVSESELPTFRAIQLGEDMTKFKPDDNKIEAENIKDSVSKLLAGELKQHQMSEEIPEDWDATGVKVLVEKNFHVVAMSAEALQAPIWDKLGEKNVDHASIVIAKMDRYYISSRTC